MAIGRSFQPGQGQNGESQYGPNGQRQTPPVQQAIKLISTRLPTVLGARAPSPAELLHSPGGGGMTQGLIERLFRPQPQAPMPPTSAPPSQVMPPWMAPPQAPAQAPRPAAAQQAPRPQAPEPARPSMPPSQAPSLPPSQDVSAQVPQAAPQAPIIDTPPYVNAPFQEVIDPATWWAQMYGGAPGFQNTALESASAEFQAQEILRQLFEAEQRQRQAPRQPAPRPSVEFTEDMRPRPGGALA